MSTLIIPVDVLQLLQSAYLSYNDFLLRDYLHQYTLYQHNLA